MSFIGKKMKKKDVKEKKQNIMKEENDLSTNQILTAISKVVLNEHKKIAENKVDQPNEHLLLTDNNKLKDGKNMAGKRMSVEIATLKSFIQGIVEEELGKRDKV